jgi:hypothetical protein
VTTADLDLAHLRGLLQAATPPADTFAALAEARAAAAGPLQDEVLQAEGHWLLGVADGAPDLAQPRADAAAALRRLRARNCASAPANDVDVLFELAIAAAAHRIAGESAAADTLLVELRARAESITDTVALCQEADERYAVFTAAGDARALPMQIEAIGAAADALERIAQRTRDRRVRRRARRARRGAADRVLQLRLERLLGLRGAVLFDRVGALLLAVVLAVLLVETAVTLTPAQSTALQWVDGVACAFFVVEFVLRCSLAPHRWSWALRNVWTDLLPSACTCRSASCPPPLP